MKDPGHARLADSVYAQVKARILLGQARPGDVIAAHALAQQLSVSRTPVHEALKRLVGERFLVSLPRVGYTVTPIDIDEMRDLFQVRIRLEALSGELAARAWTDEYALAFQAADRTAQARHRELLAAGVLPELTQFLHEEHQRFHGMIANVGGNRRLRAPDLRAAGRDAAVLVFAARGPADRPGVPRRRRAPGHPGCDRLEGPFKSESGCNPAPAGGRPRDAGSRRPGGTASR